MENVMVLLLVFFAKAMLVSVAIGYLVYLKTKNTIAAVVNGFIFPFCVLTFFFLLPQTEIIAAFLTTWISFLFLLVLGIVACATSPRLQERIQREMRALAAEEPLF